MYFFPQQNPGCKIVENLPTSALCLHGSAPLRDLHPACATTVVLAKLWGEGEKGGDVLTPHIPRAASASVGSYEALTANSSSILGRSS